MDIFNLCSGFCRTAVLESVQRNPLTNAVTLQSIPLFCRFLRSEFRCIALDSTIKYYIVKKQTITLIHVQYVRFDHANGITEDNRLSNDILDSSSVPRLKNQCNKCFVKQHYHYFNGSLGTNLLKLAFQVSDLIMQIQTFPRNKYLWWPNILLTNYYRIVMVLEKNVLRKAPKLNVFDCLMTFENQFR